MVKDNKKPNIMPIFWPGKNIAEYLNLMEREANKIYDSYKFPRQNKVGFLNPQENKLLREIAEQSVRGDMRVPYALLQAFRVSTFIEEARIQLRDNEAEKLAYSIGTICAIIGSGPSAEASHAGRGRKGHHRLFTRFILGVISYTKHRTEEFTPLDVYNNIADYFNSKEQDYPNLDLKFIKNGTLLYSENSSKMKHDDDFDKKISKVNLLDKIRKLTLTI